MKPQPNFFSVTNFAKRNGISRDTVFRLMTRGDLFGVRINRKIMISRAEEARWRKKLKVWSPTQGQIRRAA